MANLFGKPVSNAAFVTVVGGLSVIAIPSFYAGFYRIGASMASRYSFLNNRFLYYPIWPVKTFYKFAAKPLNGMGSRQLALVSAVSWSTLVVIGCYRPNQR